MKKYICLALLPLCLAACTQEKKAGKSLADMHWLLGSWQSKGDSDYFVEKWQWANDSTYTGEGYEVQGGQPKWVEKLRLQKRDTTITYVATVPNQNGGAEVPFTLTVLKPNIAVFENPQHDFPNKLTYFLQPDSSLYIKIVGQVNSKPQKADLFLFRKR